MYTIPVFYFSFSYNWKLFYFLLFLSNLPSPYISDNIYLRICYTISIGVVWKNCQLNYLFEEITLRDLFRQWRIPLQGCFGSASEQVRAIATNLFLDFNTLVLIFCYIWCGSVLLGVCQAGRTRGRTLTTPATPWPPVLLTSSFQCWGSVTFLVRIRINGSVPLTSGSESGSDSFFQWKYAKKLLFFIFFSYYNLPAGTFLQSLICCLKDKFCIFQSAQHLYEKSEKDPYFWLTDPDPGGPKTHEFRSTTLLPSHRSIHKRP